MNIEEIKAREQAATTGPWKSELMTSKKARRGNQIYYRISYSGNNICHYLTMKDAAFIAHARTDIPELIAEMERLTEMYSDVEETNEKLICRAEKAESEVERLTAENATLTDTARQNYCKFVRQQEENATLKKALEIACELLTKYTCFKSKGALCDYFIQQTQEAEK
jgi:hypothetical protein